MKHVSPLADSSANNEGLQIIVGKEPPNANILWNTCRLQTAPFLPPGSLAVLVMVSCVSHRQFQFSFFVAATPKSLATSCVQGVVDMLDILALAVCNREP